MSITPGKKELQSDLQLSNIMELHEKLKSVLNNIEFVGRYTKLCDVYSYNGLPLFKNFDRKLVLEMIEGYGYRVRYMRSENFYMIKEKSADFSFQFNLRLKSGICEFIWDVLKDGQRWPLGLGVWGGLPDFLEKSDTGNPPNFLEDDERYAPPCFTNYEDLKNILTEAFEIYEDFKRELLLQEYPQG